MIEVLLSLMSFPICEQGRDVINIPVQFNRIGLARTGWLVREMRIDGTRGGWRGGMGGATPTPGFSRLVMREGQY